MNPEISWHCLFLNIEMAKKAWTPSDNPTRALKKSLFLLSELGTHATLVATIYNRCKDNKNWSLSTADTVPRLHFVSEGQHFLRISACHRIESFNMLSDCHMSQSYKIVARPALILTTAIYIYYYIIYYWNIGKKWILLTDILHIAWQKRH